MSTADASFRDTVATRASTTRIRWAGWIDDRVEAPELFVFRRVFAAIWLAYDLLDIAFRGTVSAMQWGAMFANVYDHGLLWLQLACIGAEILLLVGRPSDVVWIACAVEFLARWRIGEKFFGLNDFRHITVVALLLMFVPAVGRTAPRWIVDLLRWQTAWVYLATGALKVNGAFLSGGHLYVRHNYLRLRGWPYPGFVSDLLAKHWVNRGFAIFSVLAELSIGILLLVRRRYARNVALILAIAVHGGAALLIDVWFFGASMIALVWCVGRQSLWTGTSPPLSKSTSPPVSKLVPAPASKSIPAPASGRAD